MFLAAPLAGGALWFVHPWAGVAVALAAVLLAAWGVWFFRDPDRTTPPGPHLIISPADGVVIKLDRATLPRELDHPPHPPMERVAIFLNLFNVHVNRVPAQGTIAKTAYVPGKFFNASLDKASEHNERSAALLVTPTGAEVGFVQIAGLVAKRIVNHLRVGLTVRAGDRFGLIRFGSRAEVYLPPGTVWKVKVGDKVVAGETILAELPSPTPAAVAAAPTGGPP